MSRWHVLAICVLTSLNGAVTSAAEPQRSRPAPFGQIFPAPALPPAAEQSTPQVRPLDRRDSIPPEPGPAQPGRFRGPIVFVPPVRPAHEPSALTVVCGLTIIPVDPGVDPKMLHPRPMAPDVTHTLRIVPPPVCPPR